MCGVLISVGDGLRADFNLALAKLHQRGPDARVSVAHGNALLGHTRLAVIDLVGGKQPMLSADGRLCMVFNGEIYNFKSLRYTLEKLGHHFSTRSDSEVLLVGYQQWGSAILDKLDGIFAFAIHDLNDGSVFVARDRLGVKPLFWGECASGFIAASTMAPFFSFQCFPKRIDPKGLRDYLAFQTPISPNTLVEGIHSLPPGCFLQRNGRGATAIRQWWNIPAAPHASIDHTTLAEETDRLFNNAVKGQLVADVPLGAFLSGGIDSSLVVHYMANAGAAPIRTFSVRFPEAGFDESSAAIAVAQQYGTEHHILDAPTISADLLDRALSDLDQPLADPAYLPTWALSQITRQHVTVALSGDGGDELFAGYARYQDSAERHPDGFGKRTLRTLLRHGLAPGSCTRRGLSGKALLLYRHVELGNYPGSRKDMGHYVSPDLLSAMHTEATLERWSQLVEQFGPYDCASLMRADLWTYLSENCLVKTDRASMAHGLEVRVPILANALQDFALSLPAEAHFDASGGKALLRTLAKRHLPEIVWNREKHGFSVPLRANFSGHWREWVSTKLEAIPKVAPWLNHASVCALDKNLSASRGSVRLLYTLLVLTSWLETHPVAM